MLTAIYDSELMTIVCAALFSVSALLFPVGITVAEGVLCIFEFALLSMDSVSGVIRAFAFIVPALTMTIALKKGRSLSHIVSAGTLSRGVMLTLYYYYESVMAHTTIRSMMLVDISKLLIYRLEAMGFDTSAPDASVGIVALAGNMIPVLILSSALVFAFLTAALITTIVRRTGGKIPKVRPVGEICADRSFSLAAVLVCVAAYFIRQGTASYVLLNAFYFNAVIFFGFGLAATTRILKRFIKHGFPAFLLAVVIAFMSGGGVPVLLGIVSPFVKKQGSVEKASEKGIDKNESGTDEGC